MADWLYTNVLHEPRKALGISVLEYCVLDYIYKTQTHPTYGKNGWTNAGCHRVAAFFDLSSGTVKKLFDRMDEAGLLERVANDMKRATEKFYSIAYESDVQKVNDYRSKSEQICVQKVNSNRSKSEHYNKKNEITEFKLKEKGIVECNSTVTLIDEVDGMSVEIHHIPDYFEEPVSKATKKPKEKSSAKKEKPDDPAPITPMFEVYAAKFAELNNGQKPEFMKKYAPALKNLYGILEARSIERGIVPLDKLQLWRDFVEMWGNYLKANQKETWHRDNFNPMTFFSQFNSIIAKLQNRPQTDAEKWVEWMKKQGIA